MASAKVVLFTSKTMKDGGHPLMLRVIQDRKIRYINLHVHCHPDLWDDKNGAPKKKHPLFHEINVLISQRANEAKTVILDLEKENRAYSADEVIERMNLNHKRTSVTVLDYFQEIIEKLRAEERLGYAAVFSSTRNYLAHFRMGKDFGFADINLPFIIKFDEYLAQRGMKPNSAFMPMRTFKTLLNNAKRDGLVKPDYDPFREFSFTKYRKDKPQKRAIKREHIRTIEHLEFEVGTPLWHARNYFVFSYYCAGINFIDMAYLKWENIRQERIVYIRKKTKEPFNIGLLPPALEILEVYKNLNLDSEGYVFPILNTLHQSAKSKDYRIDKVLKQVNDSLKKIAELAGIEITLTTYVARHSFATNLKQNGVSTAIISQALGHESERTTQLYLDSFENSVVDEALKSIL